MPQEYQFRHRAHEVSRIEAFSDIVFGFALTLIVVSLEVPKTFKELMEAMKGFPAFALCFAILLWIWHAHYTFYRRYAIHDEFTLVVNSTLLFVVVAATIGTMMGKRRRRVEEQMISESQLAAAEASPPM